jgi:hypothetical protein
LHRDPKNLDRPWGVDPSQGCIVPETFDEKLNRHEARWAFEAIMQDEPEVPEVLDTEWLRETLHDPALAEANMLLNHYHDHATWPELGEDEDLAYPPMQAELDAALDRRESIAKRLIELQDDIRRLQGSERTVNRGLVGLPDEVDVSGAEIVLRDKGGTVLGTWRVADGENIRGSLGAVELEPVDVPRPEPEPDAG